MFLQKFDSMQVREVSVGKEYDPMGVRECIPRKTLPVGMGEQRMPEQMYCAPRGKRESAVGDRTRAEAPGRGTRERARWRLPEQGDETKLLLPRRDAAQDRQEICTAVHRFAQRFE